MSPVRTLEDFPRVEDESCHHCFVLMKSAASKGQDVPMAIVIEIIERTAWRKISD